MPLPKDVFDNPSGIIPRFKMLGILGGSAGNHTLTGVAVGDRLAAVLHIPQLTEGTPNAFNAPVDLTSEFTVTAANTINNTGGTDTSDGMLLILLVDKSYGDQADAPWIGN